MKKVSFDGVPVKKLTKRTAINSGEVGRWPSKVDCRHNALYPLNSKLHDLFTLLRIM